MGACHLRGSAGSYGAGSGVRQNVRTMLMDRRRTCLTSLAYKFPIPPSKSALTRLGNGRSRGNNGARTSANANGVRSVEDYSENGDAWNYFTHDQARSRAYHWGEDGLAGISDDSPAAVLRAGALERQGSDP